MNPYGALIDNARAAMIRTSSELRKKGTSLEDLMNAGRKARAKLAAEKYGAKKPDIPARLRR
jgi:hypothetical protein